MLLKSIRALTEVLRPEADTIPAVATSYMDSVQRDYYIVTDAISELFSEEQN